MNLSDAIVTRINNLMKEKNIDSLWELYKITGVPKATLNSLLSTRKTAIPDLKTLLQIANGLGCSLQDFFNDSIFSNIEDNI